MSVEKFKLQLAGRTLHLCFDLDSDFYSDQVLLQMLPRGILPEPEVINALSHLVKRGDTVIDAGANIGFFTIILSKLVGSEGRVIAIEPDPRNIAKLQKNIDINGCPNVVVYESPLANISESRDFFMLGENGSSTLYKYESDAPGDVADTKRMQTRTLTDIIGDAKPTFMKMDIEGAELAAIVGCDYRIPFVVCEANKEALARAGASIEKLRWHFEQIWGHHLHLLEIDGSMPARMADHFVQKLVTSRSNTNVLFAKEWDVIRAWPEVKI